MNPNQEKLAQQHKAVQRGAPPLGAFPPISRFDYLNLRNTFAWSHEEMAGMLGITKKTSIAYERGTSQLPTSIQWVLFYWQSLYLQNNVRRHT
jgi:protein-S-isoprenylcysteine O-methyltransferase Ste14